MNPLSILLFLGIVLSGLLPAALHAQVDTNESARQAAASLRQKEFAQARTLYLRAYDDFSAQGKYAEAVECGTQACALYYRAYGYTEAFNLCRQLDQFITLGEQQQNRAMPELHFKVTRERLRMYLRLKNAEQAETQLLRLKEWAAQAGSATLSEELLYAESDLMYTFGRMTEGDAVFRQLIARYKAAKQYEKVNDCYRRLIRIASDAGNAPLVEHSYERWSLWQDSLRTLNAADAYGQLRKAHETSQQQLTEQAETLAGKHRLILLLCGISLLLLALLACGVWLRARTVASNRRLKRQLAEAYERSGEQARLVRNLSAQMRPTLDRLEAVPATWLPEIRALHRFVADIEELASLEADAGAVDPRRPLQVAAFCQRVAECIREEIRPGVTLAVEAAPLEISSCPETLERILRYLLLNAATHTTTGKVKLEFKKRAAHAGQFIVTDTGCGIPSERQATLFTPFSQSRDLVEGDGLGLPICARLAARLNGTLSLDTDYKRGCRFLLHLEV